MVDNESHVVLHGQESEQRGSAVPNVESAPRDTRRKVHFRMPLQRDLELMIKEPDDGTKMHSIDEVVSERTMSYEWPVSTTSYCFWDVHPFDTIPCGVPLSYDERADTYYMYGRFCSWNCVKAYILRELSFMNTDVLIDYVDDITTRVCNFTESCRPADPRDVLHIFTGTMMIDDFRRKFCTHVVMTALPYPMMCTFCNVTPEVQETILLHKMPNASELNECIRDRGEHTTGLAPVRVPSGSGSGSGSGAASSSSSSSTPVSVPLTAVTEEPAAEALATMMVSPVSTEPVTSTSHPMARLCRMIQSKSKS